jgi:hypothetical protein
VRRVADDGQRGVPVNEWCRALLEVGDQLRAVVARQPEDDTGDPVVNLDKANRRYLHFYRVNARILTAVEEAATVDTVFSEFRVKRREHHVDRVTATSRRLQEHGLADPTIDAQYTAGALVAMLSSLAYWSATIPGVYDEERTAQTVSGIWVQAIGLRRSAPPPRTRIYSRHQSELGSFLASLSSNSRPFAASGPAPALVTKTSRPLSAS